MQLERAQSRMRWPARCRGLIVAAAAGAAPAAVNGQAGNHTIPLGYFLTKPAVSIASVRTKCPELGDALYADVPQIGTCARLGVRSLGVAGGRRWYSALFERRWSQKDSLYARVDTVGESELVLFAGEVTPPVGGDILVTPVWHNRFEREMFRSAAAEVVSVGGGVLVAIDQCYNGTGGCFQDFFLLRGGRRALVRTAFLDSLNRRFPNAINHGFHVDVRTLHASAAVYSATDANCCPSRTAEMRLRLRANALEIVDLEIRRLNDDRTR